MLQIKNWANKSQIKLKNSDIKIYLNVTDFNRMRWTVAALRSNNNLFKSFISAGSNVINLLDSTSLNENKDINLLVKNYIILWDGAQSLVRLWKKLPDLKQHKNITYLYVGNLFEINKIFTPNSMPLFPESANTNELNRNDFRFTVPKWIDIYSQIRSHLRPLKNIQIAPQNHKLLNKGGLIVFCGVVRPNKSVINDIFFGSTLLNLRKDLIGLENIEWRRDINKVRSIAENVFEKLINSSPCCEVDFACIYSLMNVLHRIGTLSQLSAETSKLFVNEYGMQKTFDPYNTSYYSGNTFVDFGSARGPEKIYPRSIDIIQNRKMHENLRLIDVNQSITKYLRHTSPEQFWRKCQEHAEKILLSKY